MSYYKLLTSDLRPPIQGGDPLYSGALPVTLPTVKCDTSSAECGTGWNFVRDIETGFKIAGMWRTGRPNVVLLVEPQGEVVERGDKCRASSLTLVRHADHSEIREALERFSKPFGEHQSTMAEEQWLWWLALERPRRDRAMVEDRLRAALKARALDDWTIKEYDSARAAWDARAAWAAWDARDAWAAWDAWAARDAWDARDAWAARAAWDAWDARDALIVSFAARSGWISHAHNKLTVGIRDAYFNGLEIAVPVGPKELGWSMEK